MISKIEKNFLHSVLVFNSQYRQCNLDQLRYYDVEDIEREIHRQLANEIANELIQHFQLKKELNEDMSITYSIAIPTVKLDKYHELMKKEQDTNGND